MKFPCFSGPFSGDMIIFGCILPVDSYKTMFFSLCVAKMCGVSWLQFHHAKKIAVWPVSYPGNSCRTQFFLLWKKPMSLAPSERENHSLYIGCSCFHVRCICFPQMPRQKKKQKTCSLWKIGLVMVSDIFGNLRLQPAFSKSFWPKLLYIIRYFTHMKRWFLLNSRWIFQCDSQSYQLQIDNPGQLSIW